LLTLSLIISLFLYILRPPPSSTLFPYTTLFRSGAVYDWRYRRSDSPEHHDHPDVDRVDDERGKYQPDRVFKPFAAGDWSGFRDFCDYGCRCGSRGWSRDRDRDVQEQRDDERQRDRSDEVVRGGSYKL